MQLMWRLLLFSALAVLVHCSCPSGFELVINGECRGSLGNMSLSPDTAVNTIISECNEILGQPVIIHNDEQNSYWSARASPTNSLFLILGLICNASSKKWQWADGSPLDYKPPIYHSALDSPCNNGYNYYVTSVGSWNRWGGETYNVYVSCTTQLHQPDPSPDGCESFEDDSDDGVCYQVGDTAESWNDAQIICKKLGANLASIHNQQENSFVRRLAVSNSAVSGLYLGATRSGKGDSFGWIDGSDWDYSNFASGFPKAGFGDCIGMDTSNSTGQWKNIDCTEKLPVACIREQRDVNPTCSTETWKEGALITSPGFPYTSSTPCDYYLIVDEGKRVEVEIVFLEANSCCDHLIVYDGYFGKTLANLTSEVRNVTFTTTSEHIMQVSWQPNGGVNVMGFAMTFRGV